MTAETVLGDILRKRGVTAENIDPTTPLGGDGLGLDSIALAEVLLDCEEQFGMPVADLLNGDTITYGDLVERLERQ